ncbi:hypothetical protein B6U74_02495 [Candidatus Bathyarchaeota archaeon ex4484_205]|nr:MAG: hypothetical protein B6U74_02495 [Candidatus Bathyarchaeota archaeon ex4484_205]
MFATLNEAITFIRSYLTETEGPPRVFDTSHIILALYYVFNKGPCSRTSLSAYLNLGEGSIKSMIRIMKNLGLINTTFKGCYLTELGSQIIQLFRYYFPLIVEEVPNLKYVKMGNFNSLIVLRHISISNFIKLRDMFIRKGAEGASILHFQDNILSIPLVIEDLSIHSEEDYSILHNFPLKNGDFLVICGADIRQKALIAAISGLLSSINLFIHLE